MKSHATNDVLSAERHAREDPTPCSQDPPRLWLSEHTFMCQTPIGAILLDLRQNRYFGVSAEDMGQLLELLEPSAGSPKVSAEKAGGFPEIVTELLDRQLLSREAPYPRTLEAVTVPCTSALKGVSDGIERRIPLRTAHVYRFLRACAWAKHRLRRHSLYAVACEIFSAKKTLLVPTSTADKNRLIELVGVFQRLRPIMFTAKDQCLFHSLALVRFLQYYGLYGTWVIGVQASPWLAHSWVQQDDVVLNTHPEDIYEYTTIFAL